MAARKGKKRRTITSAEDRVSSRRLSADLSDQRDPEKAKGSGGSQDRWFVAVAGAIVLLAFLLRIYRVGAQELWIDEALSWHLSTTTDFLRGLLNENNPPLYYLLLRVWVGIAGQSEASLRLLSAGFGTLFVAAMIWLGREVLDARVGLWSGAVAAVSPVHIYYSQEARAYALLTLTLTLSYAMLWHAYNKNTWRAWAMVSVGTLLALYTHYFAILGLLSTAFFGLVRSEKPPWRWHAGAMLASSLLFLPWMIWSVGLTVRPDVGTAWISEVWKLTPPLLALPRSLEVFALGSQAGLLPIILKQFTHLAFPAPLRFLGLITFVLLGIWLAIPWHDQQLGVPNVQKKKAWVVLALLLPLVLLWLVSFFKPVYVAGRYDLVAYPAYPLLVGLALAKVQRLKTRGRVLALLAALLLVIPIGVKLFRYYEAPSVGDARKTSEVLYAKVRHGDVVVFTGVRGIAVLYYLARIGFQWEGGYCRDKQTGRRFGCRMYPRETEHTPASMNLTRIRGTAGAVREEVQAFLRPLSPEGALWIIFQPVGPSQQAFTFAWVDTLLDLEVEQLGFRPEAVDGPPGIFRFRRPG